MCKQCVCACSVPRWVLPDLHVRQPVCDPEVGQGAAPDGPLHPGGPGGSEGVELQTEPGGAEAEGEPAEPGRQLREASAAAAGGAAAACVGSDGGFASQLSRVCEAPD